MSFTGRRRTPWSAQGGRAGTTRWTASSPRTRPWRESAGPCYARPQVTIRGKCLGGDASLEACVVVVVDRPAGSSRRATTTALPATTRTAARGPGGGSGTITTRRTTTTTARGAAGGATRGRRPSSWVPCRDPGRPGAAHELRLRGIGRAPGVIGLGSGSSGSSSPTSAGTRGRGVLPACGAVVSALAILLSVIALASFVRTMREAERESQAEMEKADRSGSRPPTRSSAAAAGGRPG